MKNKAFYIILCICLLFISVNVKAEEKKTKVITVRFIVGCETSERAYQA